MQDAGFRNDYASSSICGSVVGLAREDYFTECVYKIRLRLIRETTEEEGGTWWKKQQRHHMAASLNVWPTKPTLLERDIFDKVIKLQS